MQAARSAPVPNPCAEKALTEPTKEGQRLSEAVTYASDVGVLGVLRGLTRLRGLILLPIVARGLGAATYGVWTQSLVAVYVGMSIITLQLDTALVRFVSGTSDRQERRDIFLAVLVLIILLGLALSILTLVFPDSLAAYVLGDLAYIPIARLLGLWTGLTAVAQLGLQLQRGVHRVKLYGVLGTVETLGQMAIVAVLILMTGNLLVAVQGAVFWELLFALAVLILAFREVGLGWPKMSLLRPSLQFSLPLVPSYYAGTVLSFADRLVVAAQLGSEAVGIYTAAYSLARIVRELFTPISTALLPAAARAWDEGDKERGRWLLFNTLHYYTIFSLPALIGLAVLGPAVLRFLAPATAGQDVGWLVLFMGVGYFSSGLEAGFAIVLQIVKRTRALAVSRGTSAILYVPLVFFSVSKWGLVGGALATGTAYVIELGLTYYLARRYERIDVPIKLSTKGVIAAAGMALIIRSMDTMDAFGLLSAVLVGACVYGALMILMRGLGRRELRFAVSLIAKRSASDGAHHD